MTDRPRVLVDLGDELERAARRRLGEGGAWTRRARVVARPSIGGVVATLVAVGALALGALAVLDLSHTRGARLPAGARAGGAVAPPAGLARAFAAYGRPQRPTDRLPAQVALAVRHAGLAAPSGLTRLVIATPRMKVWLVADARQAASVVARLSDGGIAATSVAASPLPTAESQGLAGFSGGAFTAILPRTVGAVSFRLAGGRRVTITPNADGAIARTFGTPVRAFSYALGNGSTIVTRTVPTPLPGTVTPGGSALPPVPRGARLLRQANLAAPHASPDAARGIADVYALPTGGRRLIRISAIGMHPLGRGSLYAVWLENTPGVAALLGFISQAPGRGGRLATEGLLPKSSIAERLLLVTIEHHDRPSHPGRIVLRGHLSR